MCHRIIMVLMLVSSLSGCSDGSRGEYTLRTYGAWPVGEARTCLLAKDIESAPCFTSAQIQNGTQEQQHEYLVSVALDKAIPFGDSGVYGVPCRRDSDTRVSCHVAK